MARRTLLSRGVHLAMLLCRPVTLGVRGVVEDGDGGILLVRHTYVKGWHFPGGGVEPRETAQEALMREVEEETAVRLTGTPELIGVYLNRRLGERDHVLFYRCRQWESAGDFKPDMEIAEARFFARGDLPDDLSRGTRRRIAELAGEVAISPDW
ncbi:MAG: NUDIX domain-containing protein [Nitratireductor sp.]|nr:NUDIX domain-containing protein [Nitratireductor sp.]